MKEWFFNICFLVLVAVAALMIYSAVYMLSLFIGFKMVSFWLIFGGYFVLVGACLIVVKKIK